MLVERSIHPEWLSNAYLVADEEGGAAVFVDSGADVKPLLEAAERWRVEPSFVLRTHSHHDHVVHEGELGLPVRTDAVEVGGLHVEALPTPGHSDDMVAFVVNGEAVFTGDTLFKDSVGGVEQRLDVRARVDEDGRAALLVGDEVGVREPVRVHRPLDYHRAKTTQRPRRS